MLKQLKKSLVDIFVRSPVTEDTLRETYRQMPEKELMRIKLNELTPIAHKLWREEVSRRAYH
ncbi:hypothetical protein ACWPKO_12215 [Coraliomargarita sp. W4R53]